ncbi:hypothetical protein ACSDR0_49455 [Streptosporangium sp. G11]|uniref:hypothetical protein n=1 Tax=Streptosporangium sp. G11 TaxID=3436926 RepID=UPI003EC03435
MSVGHAWVGGQAAPVLGSPRQLSDGGGGQPGELSGSADGGQAVVQAARRGQVDGSG